MPRRRIALFRTLALAFLLSAARPACAEEPLYTALRNLHPESTGFDVKDLTLTRDVIRLRFESGSFFFLPEVQNRTVGAVFLGHGSYELTPSTAAELQHLSVRLQEKDLHGLTDTFESLVLFFTDATAQEIRGQSTSRAAPAEARVRDVFERHLKRQRKDYRTNFHLRILADLLEGTAEKDGVFLAFVDGKKRAPSLLAVDFRGIESLGLESLLGGEQVACFSTDEQDPGFWYLSHREAEEKSGKLSAAVRSVDALHYVIDMRIKKNTDVEGKAILRFRTLRSPLRVLPLGLLAKLRISEAGFARGEADDSTAFRPVSFVQEDAKADADAAVVFPESLSQGDVVSLRIVYKGEDVLGDAGDGNFVVGARTSWYPNLGAFSDPATFDLTFHAPKKGEVVSVGTRVESRADPDGSFSRWKAELPIRVAGFNYGQFRKLERVDSDSGFRVQVYTNPGTPNAVHELEEAVPATRFDTEKLAESALVDGINAARTYTAFYGPLPKKEVAITQQSQWSFGQSWPSLIFLPYLAFLDGTTRHQLGLTQVTTDAVEQVGFHEFAHQWWGHLVGWGSYRDVWLSEGFAEFSAALVVNQTGGRKRYDEFWEKARRRILEKPIGSAVPNFEAGPISLGVRLGGRRTPGAYFAIVYEKGAYVLQMLRRLLWDARDKPPDSRFMAVMKDFAASYAGQNPTTADFQQVVERQMVPWMNLTRDGKMDWFFQEWVYGTEIPSYKSKLDIHETAGGKYAIDGEVTQSNVSADFRMQVPLYIEFGKGEDIFIGRILLVGNTTNPVHSEIQLPKKPTRMLVNAMHDVLAREP